MKHFMKVMLGGLLGTSVFSVATGARAADNWRTGAIVGAGVMQQPSSQYFLMAYSANAFLEFAPAKAGISLTAFGRPRFSAGNFEDQDFGGLVELRKGVAARGSFSLGASIGGGQMRGYVKSIEVDGARSDYRMDGVSATVDLRYATGKDGRFKAQLSHTMFSGLSTAFETKARVAWPWSFVMLGIGYSA
ncbi:hypothetical protein EBZ80_14350 [bacterium]|nr:hypothetical protein [bacterium]